MSPEQLHILHHTLGVTPERREPYRNYYMAGSGHHSMHLLETLEAVGFMRRSKPPAFCDQDDVLFSCTETGRSYALEHLPPEPKRTKYDEYCRSELFDGFGAFLGIRVPKIETDGFVRYGKPTLYRMYREQWDSWDRCHYRDVQGNWAPTKKAAKESYKAALNAKRDAGRREKGFA